MNDKKFHLYVDGYDRLKEGDYIRLAGRVGIIKDDDGDPDKETREFDIEWQDGIHDLEQIYLLFPRPGSRGQADYHAIPFEGSHPRSI